MKRSVALLSSAGLFGFLLLAAGCVGARPALSERPLAPPPAVPPVPAAVEPPWPTPPPVAASVKRLHLGTRPESAEVYIDRRYRGLTPLTLFDQPAGQYYVEIVKPGFRTLSLWINYARNQQEWYWTLERETGTLAISVRPETAEIEVGGRSIAPGAVTLPAGTHTVTGRAFGYRPRSEPVIVRPNETAHLEMNLERTDFDLRGLAVSRAVFNPFRPGPAASVAVFFSVTGPGSVSVAVRDGADRAVARCDIGEVSGEAQCVVWNGRDDAGRTVPDGDYRIVCSGSGAEGGRSAAAEISVRVDAAFALEHQTLLSGAAGLSYVPSPAVLPAAGVEISTLALAGLAGDGDLSVPVSIGGRIGLGLGHEIDVSVGSLLSAGAAATVAGSAAWKYQWLSPPADVGLSAALLAKLTWHHGYYGDLLGNPTAVSVGLPARLSLGPVALFVDLEGCLALYKITDEPSPLPQPGAYPWLYGRVGVSFTAGIVMAGLSASFRTRPFDEGFGVALPVPIALEIAVSLPESSIYVSAAGIMECGENYWRVRGGFGFGLLW